MKWIREKNNNKIIFLKLQKLNKNKINKYNKNIKIVNLI